MLKVQGRHTNHRSTPVFNGFPLKGMPAESADGLAHHLHHHRAQVALGDVVRLVVLREGAAMP